MQIEKLTKKEQLILDFLKDNNVDMAEIIDVIIKVNGFVGVVVVLVNLSILPTALAVIFGIPALVISCTMSAS